MKRDDVAKKLNAVFAYDDENSSCVRKIAQPLNSSGDSPFAEDAGGIL